MKILLRILLGLFTTVLLLVFGIFAFPELLNPALNPLLDRLLPEIGVKMEAGTLQPALKRSRWNQVQLTLDIRGASLSFDLGKIQNLDGTTTLQWTLPASLRWVSVKARADKLDLDLSPDPSEEPSDSGDGDMFLPEQGEVSLPQVSVQYEQHRFEGELQANQAVPTLAHIGLVGQLVSHEEKNFLAATFAGNPQTGKGTLNANVTIGANHLRLRGDNALWDVLAKGPWGKLELSGPGLHAFQGTLALEGQTVSLRECRVGSAGGQCLISLNKVASVLVSATQKDSHWTIALEPRQVPPWVLSHGKEYSVTIQTDPLQVTVPPLIPPIVVRWEKLIAALPDRFQVIPRPFNALGGTLSLSTDAPLVYAGGKLKTQGVIQTDLHSKDQVLRTRIVVNHDPSGGISLAVHPEAIRLVAPPVDVIRKARFVPEDRLRAPAGVAEKPSTPLAWSMDATKGYPLGIELPERGEVLEIQGKLSSPPLVGWVNLRPTQIRLLNKDMKIRRFRASPLPTGEWKLSSQITSDFSGYQIFIDLGGTSQSTQISLSSSPPLTEREIVGLLLFGKLSPAMSPTEKTTTEDFQAAAMDGAFNLLSLYFLSRTPIRALSYNPVSGRVGISLALSETSSVTLETETGQNNSLEWQKRLGGNWWFTTKVYSEDGVDPSQGQTFLEWIKQYE